MAQLMMGSGQQKKPQTGYVPPLPKIPSVVKQPTTPNAGIPAGIGNAATFAGGTAQGIVPKYNTPNPNGAIGMAASAVGKPTMQQTPMPMPASQTGVGTKQSTPGVIPSYGSNIAGFDPNNDSQNALADAGQAWAKAKASGDTAGMAAAAALGQQLRAGSGVPTAFDAKSGVTAFGMPETTKREDTSVVPTTPNAYESPVNLYPQLTPAQIAEEQRAKAAALIQQRTTAANQAKAGINTSFDRLKTNIGQDRALENTFNDRQLSPFSGRSDFAQGMIAMERGRSDREAQQDLQTRLANIDVSLQDFENATEDQKQAMINESIRQERDYGLRVDNQQYGQWSDGRNFNYQAGQDKIQNDAQYGGVYNGNQTVAQQQQSWENRFNYGQATGTFGNGQQTLQKATQDWSQAFQQGQFNFEKAQTAWDNNFKDKSFLQSMNEAAAGRGLQWASLNQRDKEFIADQAFREKSFTYQQEQDTLKNRNQPPVGLDPKVSTNNYNTIYDDLNDPTTTKEEARKLLTDNSANLTDADYKKINDYINDNF